MRKKIGTLSATEMLCVQPERGHRDTHVRIARIYTPNLHMDFVLLIRFFRAAALKFNLIFVQVLMIRQDWECLKLPGKRSVGNVHLKFPQTTLRGYWKINSKMIVHKIKYVWSNNQTQIHTTTELRVLAYMHRRS